MTLADIRNADRDGLQDQAARRRGRDGEEGIEQRVHPTLVPKGSPVADTDGVFNAVVVKAISPAI